MAMTTARKRAAGAGRRLRRAGGGHRRDGGPLVGGSGTVRGPAPPGHRRRLLRLRQHDQNLTPATNKCQITSAETFIDLSSRPGGSQPGIVRRLHRCEALAVEQQRHPVWPGRRHRDAHHRPQDERHGSGARRPAVHRRPARPRADRQRGGAPHLRRWLQQPHLRAADRHQHRRLRARRARHDRARTTARPRPATGSTARDPEQLGSQLRPERQLPVVGRPRLRVRLPHHHRRPVGTAALEGGADFHDFGGPAGFETLLNLDNHPPTATDDSFTTPRGHAADHRQRAHQRHGSRGRDAGRLPGVRARRHGTVVLNPNGTFTYTPPTRTTTAPTRSRTPRQTGPTRTTATVSITVTPVNDPPVARDDTGATHRRGRLPVDVTMADGHRQHRRDRRPARLKDAEATRSSAARSSTR